MRGRSSSKQWKSGKEVGEGSMEIDKVDKGKEDPHLSGAYIRSLVKHLTSSRTKDPLDGDGDVGLLEDLGKPRVCIGDQSQPPPIQQPQHKKQVRRRLHTSRPYQERLLNMAEARREIVTALKFHRASMKHQEANINLDHQSQPLQPSQQMNSKSRRLYASATASASIPASESMANNFCSDHLSCPSPLPYFWPISPPPLLIHENLNFPLPDQTLGLNLNFQEFNNLATTFYHSPVSMHSSPSTCSSAAISSVATGEIEQEAAANRVVLGGGGGGGGGGGEGGGDVLGGGLHQAMDDGEMEEIRSLGEQHQMEWNDTLNLMTSARWFKFLKTMEIGLEVEEKGHNEDEDDDNGYSHPFDQIMEFPPWLVNANESCCLHQQSDYRFSDDYFQDPALPCMDIGEVEGIDGEWLD